MSKYIPVADAVRRRFKVGLRTVKVCPVCGLTLAISAFYSRSNGHVVSKCRKCHQRPKRVARRLIHADGYVHISNEKEHKRKAEQALGRRLYPPHCVHHFNEDRADNANQNLVICENAKYHKILHARQRVAARGGDPNADKICVKCQELLPKSEFNKNRSRWDGLHSNCKRCVVRPATAARRSL